MASIRKEILLSVPAEDVWNAVRDVGNVHRRLCPGVLKDARLEGDARVVTFANGMVVRELIVSIDDAARRFVWAAVGDPLKHHNASMQVVDDGGQHCTIVWIADVLPDAVAGQVEALMDQGSAAAKQTLEQNQSKSAMMG